METRWVPPERLQASPLRRTARSLLTSAESSRTPYFEMLDQNRKAGTCFAGTLQSHHTPNGSETPQCLNRNLVARRLSGAEIDLLRQPFRRVGLLEKARNPLALEEGHGLGLGEAARHDYLEIGADLAQFRKGLFTVHPGHAQIQDHQRDFRGVPLQYVDGGQSTARKQDGVPVTFEDFFRQLSHRCFVI